MRSRKWILLAIAAIVCIGLIGVFLWVFLDYPQSTKIDWTMQGTLITADGEISKTIEFSVKGIIKDYSGEKDNLDLEITFPDNFRYMYSAPESGDADVTGQCVDVPYYVCFSYTYDKIANTPVFHSYALSLEEEYMIISWENDDCYLVASRESNTDPNAILDYFQQYLDIYAFD